MIAGDRMLHVLRPSEFCRRCSFDPVLLTTAIVERTETQTLTHGLPLWVYLASEIKARLHEARREYGNAARAEKSVSTWRSIDRVFLSAAPFYEWMPNQIEVGDLQAWFDCLRDEARVWFTLSLRHSGYFAGPRLNWKTGS